MGPSFLAGAPFASSSHTTYPFIVPQLPYQLTEFPLANAARFAGFPQFLCSKKAILCRGGEIGAPNSSLSGNRSNRWSSTSTSYSISSCTFGFCCPCSAIDSGLPNLRHFLDTSQCLGVRRTMEQDNSRGRRVGVRIGSDDGDFKTHGTTFRKRKVLEHLALFKMKDSLTEEQEKDMLDNLWTLQYMIRNVLFTTVELPYHLDSQDVWSYHEPAKSSLRHLEEVHGGRLVQKTPEGYTHGLLSRFPTKEALAEFLESGIRWRVSQDYIYPYYDGNIFVHFEADVDDDMEPLFRRGEDFEEGLEQMMLFKLKDGVSTDGHDKFLKVANALPEKYHDLVQLTAGLNLSSESNQAYSHGIVARLPSVEAYLDFEKCLQTDASWAEVMELFDTSKTLVANYIVSPVGKSVM